MKVLIVEPYYTGSHARWVDGIATHSRHEISLLNLEGKYWKWRMQGGCIPLAKQFLSLNTKPDLIIGTDMLNLSAFLALTRPGSATIPVALYFHENQLTYPWSFDDRDVLNRRDKHYSFINYLSALTADYVLFNSCYHMDSFISALPNFLKHFPDHNQLVTIDTIREKSSVLPVGIELSSFDRYKYSSVKDTHNNQNDSSSHIPIVLWNHRWEYDKNPELFFSTLYKLKKKGILFKIIILGEQFGNMPQAFETARRNFDSEIVHFGFAESFEEYAHWLWRANILPITSYQDFFGISILEALYCGCIPCLPRRLAYPELLPGYDYEKFFYREDEDFLSAIEERLVDYPSEDSHSLRNIAARYDWSNMINRYDQLFEQMAHKID